MKGPGFKPRLSQDKYKDILSCFLLVAFEPKYFFFAANTNTHDNKHSQKSRRRYPVSLRYPCYYSGNRWLRSYKFQLLPSQTSIVQVSTSKHPCAGVNIGPMGQALKMFSGWVLQVYSLTFEKHWLAHALTTLMASLFILFTPWLSYFCISDYMSAFIWK